MNKKVSLGVTISLIAVACAITFVLTMTVSLNMYNSMVAGVQEREAINSKIKEVDSFVRGSSLYTLEEQDIINGIMNGYISGVDDEYARYYTTEENYRRQELEKGIVTGTGMNTVVSGDYLEVTQVYSGSSAAVNGIQRGTMITAIDSKSILDITPEKAQQMLEGDDGTRVNITYLTTDGTEKKVTLIRQQINIESVKAKLINGYAYIQISTFNSATAEQLSLQIDKFEAQSVLGYIFDVRDNNSADINALTNTLDRILPAGIGGYSVDKNNKKTDIIVTDDTMSLRRPMTVIVNNGTLCAGEMFALMLKEQCSAQIVGSVTGGKAEIQTVQTFKDGSAVAVSTARIYPAKSESFDDVGVKPNYVVDLTTEQVQAILFADPTTDPQLQKALEVVATIEIPPLPGETEPQPETLPETTAPATTPAATTTKADSTTPQSTSEETGEETSGDNSAANE